MLYGICTFAYVHINKFLSMANCPNCGAKLSCGCQRKTASDGKQGCVQCIPKYEEKLRSQNSKVKSQNSLGIANAKGFYFLIFYFLLLT